MLPPVAVDRVRQRTHYGSTVLHTFTSKIRPMPESVTA